MCYAPSDNAGFTCARGLYRKAPLFFLQPMYLILIAWLYVAVMMALSEATSPVGSVLGAFITFLLYGLLPMALVGYILGTPERKRRLHRQRQAQQQAWDAEQAAKAAAAAPSSPAPVDATADVRATRPATGKDPSRPLPRA